MAWPAKTTKYFNTKSNPNPDSLFQYIILLLAIFTIAKTH